MSPPLAARAVCAAALCLLPAACFAQTPSVLKWRYDAGNTGWNPNETALTAANVRASGFGKLWERRIEGQVYAQPLYVPGVDVPGRGLKNVVYVATQQDWVYAFDADSTAPDDPPLWSVRLGTPVPSDAINCFDTVPVIGITSTPVIDPAAGTMYVVPKTLEGVQQKWRLHALDIRTGERRPGWGVEIAANIPGTNGDAVNGRIAFNAAIQNQRTGLILHNGRVVFTCSAHCGFNYHRIHGWLFSYNAANPAEAPQVVCTTPEIPKSGVPRGAGGGVWMGGCSIAAEGDNLYFVTSNGPFDLDLGGPDVGNSLLRFTNRPGVGLNFSRSASDHFTPSNQEQLQGNVDLGAGGVMLIPPQAGVRTPNMALIGGKSGRSYLLNRDNLGGFNGRANQDAPNDSVQEIQFGNGFWSSPAYAGLASGSFVYISPVDDRLRAFRLAPDINGNARLTQTAESAVQFGYPSSTPVISSNGSAAGSGVAWMLNRRTGALHAFDAENVAAELYNSNQRRERDGIPGVLKFTVPTVVAGRVFVGSDGVLAAYGLNPPNRGTLDRFVVNGPAVATRGVAASFLITALDGDGVPVSISRAVPIDIVLPDNTVRRLGTVLFNRQSHVVLTRAFAAPGRTSLRVDAGTGFEQPLTFDVADTAASGVSHFLVEAPRDVIAGQNFAYTVRALNSAGQPIAFTGTVSLRLAQADGTAVTLPDLPFTNRPSMTWRTSTRVIGSAVLMARAGARGGTAALRVIARPTLTARVVLGDWGGATRPTIRVTLTDPDRRRVIQTNELPIQDDGTITVEVPSGVYDVSVKGDRWLQQTRRRVYFPLATQPLVFGGPAGAGLLNGDTNNDNVVNSLDLVNVSGDFGGPPSGSRGLTDLNGDGQVNQTDLDIVTRNFGKRGD